MKYIKLNTTTSLVVLLIAVYLLSEIIKYEKKLSVLTLLFILGLMGIISKYSRKNKESAFTINISLLNNSFVFVVFNFCLMLFLQNYYLNYETITWDVSSYLVSIQEIKDGNLPYTSQWESKSPLNYYVYYFLSALVNDNYVWFKILNDVIVFLISLNLFFYLKKSKEPSLLIFISPIIFTLIISTKWFVSEFTEFYCLFLISIAINLTHKQFPTKFQLFFTGLLFSFATLINQGSVILFFGYLIYIFINFRLKDVVEKLMYSGFGFFIPYLVTVVIYIQADLLDVLIANYVEIPLGYSESNASSLYEIRVFLREIYSHNFFLYFTILSIFVVLILEAIHTKKKSIFNFLMDKDYLFFLTGVAYYFIAGHNYYHHFIYAVFFFCFLVSKIIQKQNIKTVSIMLIITLSTTLYNSYDKSLDNLTSLDILYNSYPLKNLAIEIDSQMYEDNYSILALDYVLVLYYLEKPNYSYIIHPTNHYQEYITNPLIKTGKLEYNEILKLFNSKPEVIICNSRAIDNGGQVINVDPLLFGKKIEEGQVNSCSLDYLKDYYFLLDTSKYRNNPNLSYYKDPYKDMNVFILKKS